MSNVSKLFRGEMGLTSTFWLWYVGGSIVLAVILATVIAFVTDAGMIETGGMLAFMVWAIFISLAVINAASYNRTRGLWGWVATVFVSLTFLRVEPNFPSCWVCCLHDGHIKVSGTLRMLDPVCF